MDNLKLGYGGTKEEMSRLLKDAQKISGVKYDISNLSDVYSAIHVIQENLGVTGSTAKEASETFSGSFSAMKASAQNLMGAMATGGDVTAPMQELAESASTFLFNNAIPMIGSVFKSLPTAIVTFIKTGLPKLKQSGKDMIKSLKEGITNMLPAEMGGAVGAIFDGIGMRINTFKTLISQAMPIIQGILSMFGTAVKTLFPVISTIFQGFSEKVGVVVGFISSHMDGIKKAFEMAMPIVSSILSTAWNIISPIMDIFISIFKLCWSTLNKVLPDIMAIFQKLWDFLEPIFDGIGKGLKWIADGVGKFVGWATGEDGGSEGSSNAYGKGRVPYDNYPARLHAGERVLTRTQADQYDRAMSTRGVQLTGGSTSTGLGATSTGGTTVHIEKLADTVVIEKEADVDTVVEAMVTKFKKLVPNMA